MSKDEPFNPAFAALAKLKAASPAVEAPAAPVAPPSVKAGPPRYGPKVVVRREKKGRGGKTVTCVEGVVAKGEALEGLTKALKKALGCGASLEDGVIVLQGDLGPRAKAWLLADGAKTVVLGN